MDIVTKDFPVIAGDATEEHPHGTFEVILSAPTQDRDGEIVDSKAFDPLPDHITFDTDHSMTCDSVVGSGVPSYAEDGTLRVKGSYAQDERSQIIRQKVLDGHIRTTSVTFMAAKRVADDKGIDHVTQAELINGTFTPVPSNRESVVLASKSILAHELAEKAGARNSASDAETIQSMHNASVGLGASCDTKSAPVGDTKAVVPDALKSIIGSLEAAQDRCRDALEDAYPNAYAWLRGVLPDALVFDVYDSMSGECESYRQTYTDDGSVVTLTGSPVEVDVMEVVVPDPDTEPADEAALDSAAKAAEPDAAKSADEESVMSARLALAELEARLVLGG
jgi:hypothetical protein